MPNCVYCNRTCTDFTGALWPTAVACTVTIVPLKKLVSKREEENDKLRAAMTGGKRCTSAGGWAGVLQKSCLGKPAGDPTAVATRRYVVLLCSPGTVVRLVKSV